MKVVEESRLCGGTDFGVHIQIIGILPNELNISKKIKTLIDNNKSPFILSSA